MLTLIILLIVYMTRGREATKSTFEWLLMIYMTIFFICCGVPFWYMVIVFIVAAFAKIKKDKKNT